MQVKSGGRRVGIAWAVALVCAAPVARSAQFEFRQWRVVVDGRVRVASGAASVVELGHWQWNPGKLSEEGGSLRCSGTIGANAIASEYRFDAGRLNCVFRITNGGRPAAGALMLTFVGGDLAGTTVVMDGEETAIPKRFERQEWRHARSFTFLPGSPEKTLVVDISACHFANLRDFRNHAGRDDFQLFIFADGEGRIAFTLDLTKSADAGRQERFEGERFAWQDDLHLPDPLGGANLLRNPGFEGDFTSWAWGVTNWKDPPDREVWAIDSTVARTGARSARFTVARGYRPRMLCSMASLVKANEPCTVSFYARTDRPGSSINVFVLTAHWGVFPVIQRVVLSEDWRRHVFMFTPTNPVVQVCLGDLWWMPPEAQVDGARIWIDDVQLEQGGAARSGRQRGPDDAATDFVQKPLLAWSDTRTRDQLFASGDPAKRLAITFCNVAERPATVSLGVSVMDWRRREVRKASFSRRLPAYGRAEETLDVSGVPTRGIVRVRMDARADGAAETFWGRYAVYEPVSEPGRVHYAHHMAPTMDDVRRLQPLGVSGSLSFGLTPDAGIDRRYAEAGWLHVFTGQTGPGCPLKIFHSPLDEDAWKAYEEWFGTYVAGHAAQEYWKTFNEPNCGGMTWTPADLVRGVAAMRRQIKKMNPAAKILTPDPYNASRGGQAWIEEFLRAGGSKLVDVVAIHTYRSRPESPDLDGDIRELVKIKAAYGLVGAPIMFTEGEGYPRYTVPELGMSPVSGFWEWRMGGLTEDVGRSELLAGALMARTLLVCLKNSDHVKYYLSWRYDIEQGLPLATLATTNRLMSLLGHGEFKREYQIGEDTRTYVFVGPDRRPVAAIWSHDLKVDRGEAPPLEARMPLGGAGWELVDFMGNPAEWAVRDGKRAFEVSSFPVYLVGPAGGLDAMCDALERSTIGEGGLRTVDMRVRLTAPARAAIEVTNRLVKPVAGAVRVDVAGARALGKDVSLGPRESTGIELALPAAGRGVNAVPLAAVFEERGGNRIALAWDFRWFAVPRLARPVAVDGEASDWRGHAAIPLDSKDAVVSFREGSPWGGAADLSAGLRFGWLEDGLYLCFSVRDDVFSQKHGIESSWCGDSIQVYIDLHADGRDRPGASYDSNDETLWIAKAGGRDVVYRDYTPEWQIAFVKKGVVAAAQCAIRRAGDVTTYEVKLPAKELFPLVMAPGTTFGLGVLVNDADSDGQRRQALTTTPAGTEPHMRPELWPAAVLAASP